MAKIHNILRIGPRKPMIIPPKRNSDCLIKPVLNAIAFGGVDTGKNNAQDALNPITNGKIIG